MKRKSKKSRPAKAKVRKAALAKARRAVPKAFAPRASEQQHFLSLASLLILCVVYWFLFYITLDREVRVPGPGDIVYLISIPDAVNYLYGVIAGFLTLMLGLVYFSTESSFRRTFRALMVYPDMVLAGLVGRTLHVANTSITLGIIMLGLAPIFAADVFPGIIASVLLGLGVLLAVTGAFTVYKVLGR